MTTVNEQSSSTELFAACAVDNGWVADELKTRHDTLLAAAKCCVATINELHSHQDSTTNWLNLIAARTLAQQAIAKAGE